jgi:hypothetical protein
VGRLLQIGALLLTLATLLAPISEALDRWDPPGLGNDTEMGVFALILVLCLLLVVSRACSLLRQVVLLIASRGGLPGQHCSAAFASSFFGFGIVPEPSPPLRI